MNKQALIDQLVSWTLADKATQKINTNIPGWGGFTHQFDADQIAAIQAAGLTGRPLLVQGDPGLGKSQLASALASFLDFSYDAIPIHADTEITDLLYRVDHLERLFQAQNPQLPNHPQKSLNIGEYVHKGVLYKALTQNTGKGQVVLIDEIDKAESSLPNALLEVLGNHTISIPLTGETIERNKDKPLIIVITSNDERELPQAFLRRCAVLKITLKDADQLLAIFECHKQRLKAAHLDIKKVRELAEAILVYRHEQQKNHQYAPGTAEFLDILSALAKYPKAQCWEKLEGLKNVFMKKQDSREH